MTPGVSSSTVLTLLGFCASVLFIIFVCSRLVCALIRRRPSPPANYSVPIVRQGRGLDPAAVAAFPTRAFSAGGPRCEPDASTLCVVCLAEYEEKDILRVLPYCGHNFHVACIDIWLKQHSTCLVCRVSLHGYPDSKHAVPDLQSAVVVIPPCSPEVSRSDPCHCLFVGTGHPPRMSEVCRNEPGLVNQVQIPMDGGNNLAPSEVSSPGGENNNQMIKLRIESPRVLGRL